MKLPRTDITKARYPAIDFHVHGRSLSSLADYEKLIKLMDATGIAVICNMDAGFGKAFDQSVKIGEPFKDRVIQFARVDFEGINERGWSEKAAAELERCFRNGVQGL